MIVTVTFNPAIDHTYVVNEDLEDRKIVRTRESHFDAGGKGINVSSYIRSLGSETVATGLLGGFTGEFVRQELEEQGLKYDFVEAGTTRINTTVLAENGEHKINHSGPETGGEVVEKILEKIESMEPGKVVVSGSLPPGLDYSAVEKISEGVDAEVVVDLHGDTLGELEGDYFLTKPNRDELSEATGIRVEDVEDAVQASQELIEKGFENVLASLGKEGALLVKEDEILYAEGLEADVSDSTGAGDALLAATLSGLEDGEDLTEALEKGLAFATLVVETPGTGTPGTEEMEEYRESVKVERL